MSGSDATVVPDVAHAADHAPAAAGRRGVSPHGLGQRRVPAGHALSAYHSEGTYVIAGTLPYSVVMFPFVVHFHCCGVVIVLPCVVMSLLY